jgi:hypothetical protein
VWTAQLLADNVSIIGPNAAVIASGVVYWMGVDKFYKYDGRVQTLNCDLRRYIFSDFNVLQAQQVYAGTNEGFNEIWWFYCSANSNETDRYAVYNYIENVWYYGNMGRTAWLDSGLLPLPVAATYDSELVQHEDGVDAYSLGNITPIDAYISSSEFDIGDGHNFGYVWRVVPDLTFTGSSTPDSTIPTPAVTMTLYPMQNSGSGTGLYISNTAAWQSTSDARLKTDVKDLDSTARLMALRPVDYLWKSQETSDEPTKRNLGFIAQEVKEVFPELVGVSPDGMFSVEYTGLIAPLVKAIQEQQAMIESLRQRLSAANL